MRIFAACRNRAGTLAESGDGLNRKGAGLEATGYVRGSRPLVPDRPN